MMVTDMSSVILCDGDGIDHVVVAVMMMMIVMCGTRSRDVAMALQLTFSCMT